MSLHASPRKFTYDDYLGWPDDGLRRELIDGVVYVSPSPTLRHQEILMRLIVSLENFLSKTKLGKLFVAPIDVVLSPHDVVQPDILFVAAAHFDLLRQACIAGPTDLAVEILSPSSQHRDRTLKLRLNEQAGVGEYWILDPLRALASVHHLENDRYRPGVDLSAPQGDNLTSPLFPGWNLALANLFRD